MADHISVTQISNYIGQDVILKGWVYNRTDKGKLSFLLVRDGTGFIQCVAFKGDLTPNSSSRSSHLPQESSVIITGAVREDKRAPGIPGGYEIGIKDLRSCRPLSSDYPMSLKDHGVDFALDHRHLWIRMQSQWAILRVRATVMAATREWLDNNGFIAMDTPILTPAAAEGTTTLFETEYFDEGKAYLAQTGQLYNEANIFAFGKVYCFGPTFRAEKSKTRRHLTEFWMLEPEIAFCDLDGLMEVEEQMLTHIVQRVMRDRMPELKSLGRDISKLEKIAAPFPRISYDDAAKMIDELREKETDPEKKELLAFEWGMDFGAPHETAITSQFDKPVFVYGYPSAVKAFYMEPWPGRPEVCKICGPARTRRLRRNLRRLRAHERPRRAAGAHPQRETCPKMPSSGIWNCANMAPSPTQASAWARNASPPGCAASNTSARRLPSRGRSRGCIHRIK